MKTVYVCPTCGSDDVEELCQTWRNMNTGEWNTEGDAPPATYNYYCNNCAEAILHVDEVGRDWHVAIEWGSESWRAQDDEAPEAITYTFGTKAELDAFMLGVAEAEGWMGYKVTEDSRDG